MSNLLWSTIRKNLTAQVKSWHIGPFYVIVLETLPSVCGISGAGPLLCFHATYLQSCLHNYQFVIKGSIRRLHWRSWVPETDADGWNEHSRQFESNLIAATSNRTPCQLGACVPRCRDFFKTLCNLFKKRAWGIIQYLFCFFWTDIRLSCVHWAGDFHVQAANMSTT